jgi:MarR family transcriptional regulator for hemolysin
MARRNTLEARIFAVGLERIARAWRARNDAALAELRLSATLAYPIMAVHRLGGGARQNVVAEALGIEGPSLVRSLDALGAAGLLERRDDPSDRRAKTLHLTQDGQRIAQQIEDIVAAVRGDMLAGIPDADLATAVRVLQAIAGTAGVSLAVPNAPGPAEAADA